MLTSLLSVALAGVIIMLLPLKTVVPYIIETDSAGKTVAVGAAQEAFDPTKAQVMHFISRWTKSLWGIDSTLVKKNLEFAYGMTRGKAGDVFRQHVAAYKPIERSTSDPSLSTAVQVKAVNFLGDATALVRFVTTERQEGNRPESRDLHDDPALGYPSTQYSGKDHPKPHRLFHYGFQLEQGGEQ
ncbi:MAG: VirB8/TrbF family protein [Candidatus Thiodiazotropha sp. (ex. Lucinoma kazani)]